MIETMEFLKKMPKIELHVHIEGAVEAHIYSKIAQKNNIDVGLYTVEEWNKFFQFKNFANFIDVYIKAVSVLKKPEDYTELIEGFFAYQASQNILYSEAFLSASFLVESFSNSEILNAIEKGLKQGKEKYQIEVALIPDIARNIPQSKDAVLELVREGKERELFIGIGLGGLENGYPARLFEDVYTKASEYGLRKVAHAGEAVGAESIVEALDYLKAERIGHGIRCLEDKNLIDRLKATKTPLEICPSSNYRLKLIDENQIHPIREMHDLGVLCTLNSDDPVMFSTSLTDEYLLLLNQGFSLEELWQLNLNAIEASFLSTKQKERWVMEFKKWKKNFSLNDKKES